MFQAMTFSQLPVLSHILHLTKPYSYLTSGQGVTSFLTGPRVGSGGAILPKCDAPSRL